MRGLRFSCGLLGSDAVQWSWRQQGAPKRLYHKPEGHDPNTSLHFLQKHCLPWPFFVQDIDCVYLKLCSLLPSSAIHGSMLPLLNTSSWDGAWLSKVCLHGVVLSLAQGQINVYHWFILLFVLSMYESQNSSKIENHIMWWCNVGFSNDAFCVCLYATSSP